MPGKLPGGKVRISQTAPSIIKKTKNPATSEVQYFGLIRDLYLEDLTSNKDALEQVLEDIQDPAERNAEGPMKIGDLSIIDGIVDFELKTEDLEVLAGASLSDAEGGTLVNPRYRLSDRIAQFASFAGRGILFDGSGPVQFSYIAPNEGDLLPGTVSITTSGAVTGTGTYFSDESSLDAEDRLNRTLAIGDFVVLYNADGITKHGTGANAAAKAADECVYKVTGVTNNTSITLSPNPGNTVTGGKKLRKRYCHNSPPPFFTEAIDSTAFNAPDTYPTSSNYTESHRTGFIENGVFQPRKGFEKWWEGKYNADFRERAEYGAVTDTSETNPKFPIVKDGNISFDLSREDLPQQDNFGFRYDFWIKKGFGDDGDLFAKFKAQVNGHIRIDYFDQTGYNSSGNATGNWKTALNTADTNTFFRQIKKENPANNRLQRQEVFLQGGPDFGNEAAVATAIAANNGGVLDLSLTYNDEEGNAKNKFDGNWIPVVVRYWYGQDTVDNSTSNTIADIDAEISSFDPSFALDIDSKTITSADLKYWNNYFGFLKLEWNGTNSRWDIASSSLPTGYDANANEFAWQFEVLAYTAIGASAPAAPSAKNMNSWITTQIAFGNVPSDVLVAERYDDGTSYVNNQLELTIEGISPSNGDVIYIMGQNRPDSINVRNVTTKAVYTKDNQELFSRFLFNPDPLGNYRTIGDMLAGGTNFIEPDPQRNEFEDNPEYFKYKHGIKPLLNTYGPSRYDGFIKNRVSSNNTTYDIDYAHTKVLPIGRQKKQITSTDEKTGNNVPDPKALVTSPAETRNAGENYTFMSVEADAAGNGGNVTLAGYPINTIAAIAGSAGQENSGGKILNGADNSNTFSNALRQNITSITPVYLPATANFDNDGTFSPGAKGYSIKYASVNAGAIKFLYPAEYTTKPDAAEAFDSTTQGMISSLGLGVTEVVTGTNGRTKANKSVFIASFNKQNYGNDTTRDSEELRYFIDFLLGTRPNAEKTVTVSNASGSTGEIVDADLFGNFSSGTPVNNTEGNRLYNGALIEFYANSDALANSGEQTSSATAPIAQAYVTGYDATNQKVTFSKVSGTDRANGNHSVRVYYNYFEITKVPAKNTNAAGVITTTGLSGTSDGSTMQIGFVYNASYGLSRADTGSSLSFAETLYVDDNASAANPSLAPFSGDTELPSPPSVTVTPFDFDNQPTNPTDPGLGGLCYPPYQTQDVDLKTTVANDSTLYASTTGNYDVFFGSPQVSVATLGNKFLQVTDEFAFDFSEADRPRIIPATNTYTFPTFSANSYTHKLKVNLNPFIGAPNPTPANATGLFGRDAYKAIASVNNDNIFNDALVHSNNKPVKETFFLFAKKATGTGEQPISIMVDNNPSYT